MSESTAQVVETQKKIKGKLVLSFNKPSPIWATWTFRVVFLLTTAAVAIIAFEPDMQASMKVRYLFYFKIFDFVIWGIGRGLGIDKDKFTSEQAGNFITPNLGDNT